MTNLPPDIAAAIDARHVAMRAAALDRDIAAYADCLAETVEYVRVDGSIGDRAAMLREAEAQFGTMASFDATTVRTAGSFDGEVVRETLRQDAEVAVVAFGFVRRRWRMERRQDYEWIREGGDWRVRRVDITMLDTTHAGWGWGRVGC